MNGIVRFLKEARHYGKTKEVVRFWTLVPLMVLLAGAGGILLPRAIAIANGAVLGILALFFLHTAIGFARVSYIARERERAWVALFENVSDAVVVYTPDFRIVSINKSGELLFGLAREEVRGKRIDPSHAPGSRLGALTRVMFPSLAPTVAPISEGGWPQVLEISLDEPQLFLRMTLTPIMDETGGVMLLVKIIQDKTRERNLLQAKSDFIKVAAHELRTPLTAIQWAFESLLSTIEAKSGAQEVARSGMEASLRVRKLIDSLLMVAEIEEGRFSYTFQEADVGLIAEKAVNDIGGFALERQVRVNCDAPRGAYLTHADSGRIYLVFLNLLDNAIRYNKPGGTVTVSLEKAAGAPFITVHIANTGMGIPPEDRKRVFSRFYRGNNALLVEPNESGLGLYVAKNIVRSHGGEMSFDSHPDRETIFWFTLPATRAKTEKSSHKGDL